MYSGNIDRLWVDFSEAVLEGVFDNTTHLCLFADGTCILAWADPTADKGLARRGFATFDLCDQFINTERQCAYQAYEDFKMLLVKRDMGG